MKKNLVLLLILFSVVSFSFAAITNISVLLECDDQGGILHNAVVYTIQGVVTTINLDPTALQFYMQDATGGVQVYKSGSSAYYSSKGLSVGKEITVTGSCSQYYSMVEITPSAELDITMIGDGTLPTPEVITIADLQELTVADQARFNKRGKLVELHNIYKANPKPSGGTDWPTLGNNSNAYYIAIGSEAATPTGILRFDKETDCDENTEPFYPQNVRGIFTQNDTTPFFQVFQIQPTAYADFTPYSSVVGDWDLY